MFVVHDFPSTGIFQVESQAAELRALATVGTTSETSLRHIALSAVAHTQRPVHEHLERDIRTGFMHPAYVLQRQLTRQHYLTETDISQETDFLRRTVVHLRTGVQGDGRQIKLQQPHVLHDERIHTGPVKLPNHGLRVSQLLITQDGVHGDINAHAVEMGIVNKPCNVIQRIAGCCPRTEAGGTDVDGVCPVVDSRKATLQVFGRSQKFYLTRFHQRISFMS